MFWSLSIAITTVAAATDLWKRKIPNLLTLPAIVIGFTLHCSGFGSNDLPGGWPGWMFSLSGFAIGFGLTLVASMISNGGGGDVKLAAALGAILGPRLIFLLLGVTFISAFVSLVSYFILRDGVISTLRLLTRSPKGIDNTAHRDNVQKTAAGVKLPLGPYFFIATVIVFLLPTT